MERDEWIIFECRECGKQIRKEPNKVGLLVACGKCDTTNRIPGTAGQSRATRRQLESMKRGLALHRLGLIITTLATALLVLMILVGLVVPMRGPVISQVWGVLAWIIIAGGCAGGLCLVLAMAQTWPCLGGGRGTAIFLMGMVWPVGFMLAIYAYFSLRTRLRALTLAGAREDMPPPLPPQPAQ